MYHHHTHPVLASIKAIVATSLPIFQKSEVFEPEPGDTIDGKYLLLEEIGRGGFGVVFKAIDTNKRHVAIKMLLSKMSDDPEAHERFEREAKLLALASHRNTVKVYGSGTHTPSPYAPAQPYMVMELLEGVSLEEYIHNFQQLTVQKTLDILAQLLDSLYQAHRLGIVHRDLKPDNIFCVGHDKITIKVLDYGLGKSLFSHNKDVTRIGLVAGTPDYMAPEQACGLEQAAPASDIYAVGCIAYHMLTGQPPYDGQTSFHVFMAHMNNPIPELPGALRNHPINTLIQKAMAKDPKDRFSDIIAMLQAVLNLRNTLSQDELDASLTNA